METNIYITQDIDPIIQFRRVQRETSHWVELSISVPRDMSRHSVIIFRRSDEDARSLLREISRSAQVAAREQVIERHDGRWNLLHESPPIPTRAYDWCAVHSDYDGAPDAHDDRVVYGSTRDECLKNLDIEFPAEEVAS